MKPQSDMHPVDDIPWTEIKAGASSARGKGITEKILSIDPTNEDYCARLVKLDKGVRTGKVDHPFWEEVWVLKGHMIDEGNKVEAKRGYYCCRHPGMSHGPVRVLEEAITFEIHYMPKNGSKKPQTDLHSVANIPWTEIKATASSAKGKGVTEKILSIDPDNPDYCTRLVKLEKGYRSDVVQRHPFWEEVWVLKGHMIDEGNGITVKRGWYGCRQPGMPHGPIRIVEESITFEVHYMPKE